MPQENRYTIAALVANESGVLSQVAHLFSRKGYNIDSLAVGCTESPAVSRITIEVTSDEDRVKLLCNQLRKLIPVISVKLLDAGDSIRRELVLIKVAADSREVRDEVMQIANVFRASVIDITPTTVTMSVIGDETKTSAIQTLLAEFGILELVRTGIVAIERGANTIRDITKEGDEFDYGKHVL